jgi:SHS2 domain-containing protein
MANLRVIKKDIDFLVTEVISDCWGLIYSNEGRKSEEAIEIVSEAVDLRNQLYSKVNHPDKSNIKTYYKAVNQELLKGVDALFVKISNLASAK